PKIGHQPAAAAFSFWHAGPDLHRCAPQSRAPNRRFGGFRSESRSIDYQSASRRPIVEVGCSDPEQWQAVVLGSLISSQLKSYENEASDARTNISPVKKKTHLFGEGLASEESSAGTSRLDAIGITTTNYYCFCPTSELDRSYISFAHGHESHEC